MNLDVLTHTFRLDGGRRDTFRCSPTRTIRVDQGPRSTRARFGRGRAAAGRPGARVRVAAMVRPAEQGHLVAGDSVGRCDLDHGGVLLLLGATAGSTQARRVVASGSILMPSSPESVEAPLDVLHPHVARHASVGDRASARSRRRSTRSRCPVDAGRLPSAHDHVHTFECLVHAHRSTLARQRQRPTVDGEGIDGRHARTCTRFRSRHGPRPTDQRAAERSISMVVPLTVYVTTLPVPPVGARHLGRVDAAAHRDAAGRRRSTPGRSAPSWCGAGSSPSSRRRAPPTTRSSSSTRTTTTTMVETRRARRRTGRRRGADRSDTSGGTRVRRGVIRAARG